MGAPHIRFFCLNNLSGSGYEATPARTTMRLHSIVIALIFASNANAFALRASSHVHRNKALRINPSCIPALANTRTSCQQCRTTCRAASTAEGDNNDVESDKALKRNLDKEFVKIGLPSLVQFAAAPLCSLVDAIYLGRLGADALGGAGTAIAAQYSIAKLANDPLLRTSISLVAAGKGAAETKEENTEGSGSDNSGDAASAAKANAQEALDKAVSTALLLACTVGLIQASVYALGSKFLMAGMGLTPSSPMFGPALAYLSARALGAPAETVWLVVNGIFRGLGDTVTPLKMAMLLTGLNAILDPLFIFETINLPLHALPFVSSGSVLSVPGLGLGAAGAALGTAMASYVAVFGILLKLRQRATLRLQWRALLPSLKEYLSAGALVLVRTVGKVMSYTVCGREAALLGAVPAAAHNLMFNLGVATTQVCESVAVATQALLARELGRGTSTTPSSNVQQQRRKRLRVASWHVIGRGVCAGGAVAAALSVFTWFQRDKIVASLTTSPDVRIACLAIMPIVLVTQVAKGLAYPVNGVIMGGLDWRFTTIAMWAANGACLATLALAKQSSDGLALGGVWASLAVFMWVQVIASVLRVASGTGPWKALRNQKPRSSSKEL